MEEMEMDWKKKKKGVEEVNRDVKLINGGNNNSIRGNDMKEKKYKGKEGDNLVN